MKLKIFISIFLLFTTFNILAESQVVDTGEDLLMVCENGMEKKVNVGEAWQTIIPFSSCYSYIAGFWESYLEQLKNIYNVDSPEKILDNHIREKMFCVPGGIKSITNRQLILIVIKYLGDHPEQLNMPSCSLVYSALLQAFPCH